MRTNTIIINTSKSIRSFISILSKLKLREYWNHFRNNNNSPPWADNGIDRDQGKVYQYSAIIEHNNPKYNKTLIQSPGYYSNISASVNHSLNKTSNSYQHLLCQAIQDLKKDDDMFSYLHKELTKIKSPSICQLAKSDETIRKKQDNVNVKVKKRRINLIKKQFLLNDDESYGCNGNNIQFIEEQSSESTIAREGKDCFRKGEYNQTYTNVGTTENSLLWKDTNHRPQVKYCKRFDEVIQSEAWSFNREFMHQLRRVASDYWNYSNLCYLIKVTSFHKYANRLVLISQIISYWRNMAKSQRSNRIKNQVLYKQMNSLLLCAIKGMCDKK